MEPMEVMAAGHMAILADPTGAVFSVWQPKMHAGFGEVNVPGAYCWAELITSDLDAAKVFYKSVLGLTAKNSSDGTMDYVEFQLDGQSVGGLMATPDNAPSDMPPSWGVYFAVADADQAVEKVSQLGGSTIVPPRDIAPGRFAVVTDNVGAVFNVIALAAPLAG